MSSWDRRQLASAAGRLKLALRQVELARERLDDGLEPALRVGFARFALLEADRELRRFETRLGRLRSRPPP